MLSSIINVLKERGGALSVQELSLALDIESGALHPMLEMLVRKGKVIKVELPCKGCSAGAPQSEGALAKRSGCTQSDTMIFYKAAV